MAGLPVDPVQAVLVGAGLAGLAWLASSRQGTSSARGRAGGRTPSDWRRMAPYDEADRFYRRRAGRRRAAIDPGNAEEASFGEAGFGEASYPGHGGYETAAALVSEPSQGHATASAAPVRAAGAHRLRRRAGRRDMPSSFVIGAAAAVFGLAIGLAFQRGTFDDSFPAGAGPRIG